VPAGLLVFCQGDRVALDVATWDGHAQRFFDTRLAGAGVGEAAEVRVRVTPKQGPSGERRVSVRPRTAVDLAMADEAEARQGGGLGLLAHRCPTIWTIECEQGKAGDPLTLVLAAILASVGLGPILDPEGPEIFGVKTARAKLEAGRA